MADDHWRHTANEVKFWVLDAKSFSPFPFLLIVKSLFILVVGVIFLVFFYIIGKKGLNFPNFLRKARGWVTGPSKEVRRFR